MSTNAPDSPGALHDALADDHAPRPAAAYDANVLRMQLAILRREAAARAKAEREITAEHEATTQAATSSADAALGATRKKYSVEIEATRREHAALVQKADAFAATELKKLDDARQARGKSLQVACAKKLVDLKEEADFAAMAANETAKSKSKLPLVAFAKGEGELGRSVAQLDEALAAAIEATAMAMREAEVTMREILARPLPVVLRDAVFRLMLPYL